MRFRKSASVQALLLLAVVVALLSCRKPTETTAPVQVQGSVFLDLKELSSRTKGDDKTTTWLATFDDGSGQTARFRFELTIKPPMKEGPLGFAFTQGAFYREPGSNSEALLREISAALEAEPVKIPAAETVDRLPFNAVILGVNLSRGSGKDSHAGAFTSSPGGNWISTKVFIGEEEAEFYLNIEPMSGKAEITIKDPEYGTAVVKELGKVL